MPKSKRDSISDGSLDRLGQDMPDGKRVLGRHGRPGRRARPKAAAGPSNMEPGTATENQINSRALSIQHPASCPGQIPAQETTTLYRRALHLCSRDSMPQSCELSCAPAASCGTFAPEGVVKLSASGGSNDQDGSNGGRDGGCAASDACGCAVIGSINESVHALCTSAMGDAEVSGGKDVHAPDEDAEAGVVDCFGDDRAVSGSTPSSARQRRGWPVGETMPNTAAARDGATSRLRLDPVR
eukprot:1704486-Pleurochrysis_carterae.AAC.3